MGLALSSSKPGGYTVLTAADSVPDREIRERLAGRGFGGVISESSQWALLDGFGTLERLPLDEYFDRVLPFDPRNDGYAEKLRAFFVHDGKRLLFIPRGVFFTGGIERRLALAMGDIPYSLEYLGPVRHAGFFFPLFFLAVCGLLPIRFARGASRYNIGRLIPCLPVLAALGPVGGPAGLTLAALLVGLASALFEPCSALFMAFRYRRHGAAPPLAAVFRDVVEPFGGRWFLAALFALGYAAVSAALGFPLPAVFVFPAYLGGFGLSIRFWGAGDVAVGRPRFAPVPILRRPFRTCGLGTSAVLVTVDVLRPMLPFALAALLAALLSPFAARAAVPAELPLVTEAEYRAHAVFQASFSQRPLGRSGPPSEPGYTSYTLDADGLVSPAPSSPETLSIVPPDIPPFPLKRLAKAAHTP
jgi:hypothetical protein